MILELENVRHLSHCALSRTALGEQTFSEELEILLFSLAHRFADKMAVPTGCRELAVQNSTRALLISQFMPKSVDVHGGISSLRILGHDLCQ